MGISIASSHQTSTILAEITLAKGTIPQEGDEQIFSSELASAENLIEAMRQTSQVGVLSGCSKLYSFVMVESSPILLKVKDYLSNTSSTLSSVLDCKKPESNPKTSSKLGKDFKLLTSKNLKTHFSENVSKADFKDTPTCGRIHLQACRTLEKSVLSSQPLSRLQATSEIKQGQNLAKQLEHQVHKEFLRKTTQHETESNRKENRQREPLQQNERQIEEFHRQMERQEEEEGFAEKERNFQEENDSSEDKNTYKRTNGISDSFAKEFADYASEDSILSEILKMRVTQFDVLILFIEIMKLEIRSREQEKIARQHERELQILHMQKVVSNYKEQGKWLMMSSLGSGILAIVSGACPIIGHMKGDWIIQKLGSVFSSLKDIKKDQFIKGVTKITYAMSEMYKSTGQIHQSFAEGDRNFDQHMSELYRSDWEERTRAIDDIKDSWKNIENFLYQSLQMYHEAIRQLYS